MRIIGQIMKKLPDQYSNHKICKSKSISSMICCNIPHIYNMFDVQDSHTAQLISLTNMSDETYRYSLLQEPELHIHTSHHTCIKFRYDDIPDFNHENDNMLRPVFNLIQNVKMHAGVLQGVCIDLDYDFLNTDIRGNQAVLALLLKIYIEHNNLQSHTILSTGISFGDIETILNARPHTLLYQKEYEVPQHIPFNSSPYQLIIIDTQISNTYSTQIHKKSKAQSDEALNLLKKQFEYESLSMVPLNTLQYINDYMLIKKARHIITEQMRINTAVELLKNGQLVPIGELMFHSHASLRNDWDFIIPEADYIVNFTRNHEAGLGARFLYNNHTVSILALVHEAGLDKYTEELQRFYHNQTGTACIVRTIESANGLLYS